MALDSDWFRPLTTYRRLKQNRNNLNSRGYLKYPAHINAIFRYWAGTMDCPVTAPADPDGRKNHLGFWDILTAGVPRLLESAFRGQMASNPGTQNLIRTLGSVIWVPLNIVRGLFGIAMTLATEAVRLTLIAAAAVTVIALAVAFFPITLFVLWKLQKSSNAVVATPHQRQILRPLQEDKTQNIMIQSKFSALNGVVNRAKRRYNDGLPITKVVVRGNWNGRRLQNANTGLPADLAIRCDNLSPDDVKFKTHSKNRPYNHTVFFLNGKPTAEQKQHDKLICAMKYSVCVL